MVSLFICRPVATTLLAIGLALAGMGAFFLLPVSPLPNIDIPTLVVQASMPGASPETMSTSVATPLERHLGSIAAVTEMTSRSSVGSTQVVLQFDISRDIDGAARDVQAAINAARADLPAALRSNPTYRKFNPSDFPIMVLALTSRTLTPGQIYDQASNILQQRLSQVDGVGNVELNGASLPAIRIELNPRALFKYGIGLEDVRAAVSAANANSPKGGIEEGSQRFQLYANDSATEAKDYKDLVIAYRNNAAVRLADVADVSDGVENIRNLGIANGRPAVLVNVTKQPGANVIDVVDRIRAMIPELQAALPVAVNLEVINDPTVSIRNSVRDVEETLVLSTILVVVVVFFFMRNFRATLVPAVSVPLSLLGTFGMMYLLGFSLDNFSLMALIVSTGFVVDNTIVVLENVTRHLELGEERLKAALRGAEEVSFTVLSMSLSLVAVFFPILLLGGIVGKIFHEFAVTLTIAIATSLVISLTVTPMMCAYLDIRPAERESRLLRGSRIAFEKSLDFYRRTLGWALDNPKTIMFILLVAVVMNVYLLAIVPKGFFPSVDEGRMQGGIRADQSISFQLMQKKFVQFVDIIRADPAVASVGGFTGGGNNGNIFVTLKPPAQRGYMTTDQVIDRLRPKLGNVAGARLFLQSASATGVRAGGRAGNGTYQYTVLGDTLDDLNQWVPKITDALNNVPELQDVNSDQQDKGLEVDLKIDRPTASRLGLNTNQIDSTLYDAFGQRQVSTLYKDKNQYHVVMEVAPAFWQSPETLRDIYVSTAGNINGTQASAAAASAFTSAASAAATGATGAAGSITTGRTTSTLTNGGQAASSSTGTAAQVAADAVRNQQLNALTNTARGGASTGASVSTRVETMVPLSAFVSFGPGATPLAVNHQGPFVATTFSFGLPEGEPLSVATAAIQRTMAGIDVPITIHAEAAGTFQLFQKSLANEPLLLVAAVVTIYIVLGMLYESLIHPITILSTLPSAGVGAVLALLIFKTDFSLIALIGVILLIGIVKKNAIILIDFAISLQREKKLSSKEAIYRAALMRFRPIMMTTVGAILGALPLAVGLGEGSELRQPLGISIVGGLLLSQALTLYTTPVIYIYLDRFGDWCAQLWGRFHRGPSQPAPLPAE
ncbi:MAG TPA: efflux RND transporter permease subunit [Rhizomicrobium sp.]|nr:efflux RND transporter permease subunit [Rhizomicrobium sp.]